MAGDWVKMRSALLANPKVHAIAKAIGRDGRSGRTLTTGFNGPPDEVMSRHALRHVTVTALLCVWSAANEHSDDGKLSCCDLEDLDEIAGVPGFGEAMAAVGWAVRNEAKNCVLLPNFSEHNTTAKDRTAAERQRRHRAKCHGGVTRDSHAVTVTQRREEKISPPPPRESCASEAWETLRTAWNAGPGKPWKPPTVPNGKGGVLDDPAWLPAALEAIPRLKGCRYFATPVTLPQFMGVGFVANVLGGQYDAAKAPAKAMRPALRGIDEPPPPREWTGEDAARLAATKARVLAQIAEAS